MTVTTDSPRIYVASLMDYNAGTLHGAWIDADAGADAIHEAIQAMLSSSPEAATAFNRQYGMVAEEWAIHDYEGFGAVKLSEYESMDRVAAIAEGIGEHGPAFAAWLEYDASHDPTDADAFTDSYQGEWDSMRAYAEDIADSVFGLDGLLDRLRDSEPGGYYLTIDYQYIEDELVNEGYYEVETSSYNVYVFGPG